MDGGLACNRLLADFTQPDPASVSMFRVPKSWNHLLSDHIIPFRVMPLRLAAPPSRPHEHAVDHTDLLTYVRTATDDEDRVLAENNHRGNLSRTDRPGPYPPPAFRLQNFLEGDAGGATRWLHDTLMPCATRQARSPRGHVTLDLLAQKRLAAMSGRSGATPMLAMLDHLTRTAPLADLGWLHAARDRCRVLFAAELARLPMPTLTVSRSSPVWSRLSRPNFEGTAFDRHS